MNGDGSIAISENPSKPPQAPAWGADHCLSADEWDEFRSYLGETSTETSRVMLSIAEVERIIGRRLPAEAGLPSWWSQCPGLGDCGEGTAWRVAGMPGHYLIEFARL